MHAAGEPQAAQRSDRFVQNPQQHDPFEVPGLGGRQCDVAALNLPADHWENLLARFGQEESPATTRRRPR